VKSRKEGKAIREDLKREKKMGKSVSKGEGKGEASPLRFGGQPGRKGQSDRKPDRQKRSKGPKQRKKGTVPKRQGGGGKRNKEKNDRYGKDKRTNKVVN